MLMEQEEIPDTREEVGGHHSHSNTRAAGRERERGGRLRLCLLLAGHQQHWGRLHAYNMVQAGVEDINIDLELILLNMYFLYV